MQAVESIQVIQSRVICGGSDLDYAMQKFPSHRKEYQLRKMVESKYPIDDAIRTEEYVADECKKLAEQLKKFEESEE